MSSPITSREIFCYEVIYFCVKLGICDAEGVTEVFPRTVVISPYFYYTTFLVMCNRLHPVGKMTPRAGLGASTVSVTLRIGQNSGAQNNYDTFTLTMLSVNIN